MAFGMVALKDRTAPRSLLLPKQARPLLPVAPGTDPGPTRISTC